VSIYRSCDIRGDAAADLSPALYESWGYALGRQRAPMAKFVVGGDVRQSTPPFLAALIEGLCRAGLDVVDLGLLPTPMIGHAKRRLQAEGYAVVTASSDPASVNGLKWMLGDRPPTPDDVAALQQSEGDGDIRQPTPPRELDISFDYVASLQETFVQSLAIQQRVVMDPMHGCWAEKVRRYLHAIFPQCLFSTIHDTVDGCFGGRTPDCSCPRALHELCEAVYRERAHLGLAFDGDGDRVALVDDEGVALSAEEATYVLLQIYGEELRGAPFVCDLRFSDRIAEAAKQRGAEPIVERAGHGFLHARMCETAAPFGADIGGHYFHRTLNGSDDGLYTACRVIAYLARSEKTLAELRRGCPPVHVTPDLRVSVPLDAQAKVIQQVCEAWAEFPRQTTDGVRIDTPSGWALVRGSATEPVLTFRFEGLDSHALDDLIERFCDCLPQYGAELQERYQAAVGAG